MVSCDEEWPTSNFGERQGRWVVGYETFISSQNRNQIHVEFPPSLAYKIVREVNGNPQRERQPSRSKTSLQIVQNANFSSTELPSLVHWLQMPLHRVTHDSRHAIWQFSPWALSWSKRQISIQMWQNPSLQPIKLSAKFNQKFSFFFFFTIPVKPIKTNRTAFNCHLPCSMCLRTFFREFFLLLLRGFVALFWLCLLLLFK